MLYRILLAVHVIGIICWMAGLLYLFRLFVYHAAETENVVKERFKMMEQRLYKIITLPSMLVSFFFGIALLIINPTLAFHGWLHAKLFLVLGLLWVTHMGGRYVAAFEAGNVTKTHKYFRLFNEIPTILMILIVILVIVRPF